MTYPRRFGQYGYRTVGFGKMHLESPDQLAGWQMRPEGDVQWGKVEGMIEPFVDPSADCQDDPLDCPGMRKWSDEKELRRAGPGRDNPQDVLCRMAACEWIESAFVGTHYDRHQPHRPTLLYVGTHDPHYPYLCRENLFRYYLPRVILPDVQEPFPHPFLGLSPWPPRPLQAGVDVPVRAVQRALAAYYGKIETMDEHFGQVLQALREAGQDLDEWIIVYLSDHGDQCGEHGVWEKQKFFEGSVRVPFIIRAPKLLPQGITISENVSLVSLFATLCDLAGLEAPVGLDGPSLVPLMRGDPGARKIFAEGQVRSFFLQQGFFNVMLMRGPLKYQHYEHTSQGLMPEVLFHLEEDPMETRNFIDDPRFAAQVSEFRATIQHLRQSHLIAT